MTIAAQRTTERVAEAIRDGICSGRFVPGQHLVEIDLTQRLEISRSSLREALHQLHGDGIVTMHRYRGTHICRLSRRAVQDLLEVLEVLVRLAAERAARQSSDKSILQDSATHVALIHASAASSPHIITARQSFYDALFAIADNAEIPRVTPLRRADLFRAQIRPYQSDTDQSEHIAGYGHIARSIATGDIDNVRATVAAHFKATLDMVSRLPDEAFSSD